MRTLEGYKLDTTLDEYIKNTLEKIRICQHNVEFQKIFKVEEHYDGHCFSCLTNAESVVRALNLKKSGKVTLGECVYSSWSW